MGLICLPAAVVPRNSYAIERPRYTTPLPARVTTGPSSCAGLTPAPANMAFMSISSARPSAVKFS
jgi:hypothetical protein